MPHMRRLVALATVSAIVCAATLGTYAYVTSSKWATSTVTFYANPANQDVPAEAAEIALKSALQTWSTDPGSPFKYVYGGRVSDTAVGLDYKNVILFRNATSSSGSGVIASAHSWSSGGVRVDSDIIFWDGSWTFFTGTSGCSGGAYIEDIATHELGHTLGLGHSTDSSATMYATYSRCSQAMRTLAGDDIAGVRALYGISGPSPNQAPALSIASPSTGLSVVQGASVTFSAAASDEEDGNLSASVAWTSSLDGPLGVGSSLSRALVTVGSHAITASVTDTGGLSASAQVTVTVAEAPAAGPHLKAVGRKVKGEQVADLTWTGLTSTHLDVYRNGSRVAFVANTGAYTDVLKTKGGGSVTYHVCAASTTTCSNQATVVF